MQLWISLFRDAGSVITRACDGTHIMRAGCQRSFDKLWFLPKRPAVVPAVGRTSSAIMMFARIPKTTGAVCIPQFEIWVSEESAGISIDAMIELLNGGLSLPDLIDYIYSRPVNMCASVSRKPVS